MRVIVLALTATALLAAPLAGADDKPRVSLRLGGGYQVRVVKACGETSTHHYTFYRRGRRIAFAGRVSPAPRPGFRVELKLKRCRNNDFKTLSKRTVRGGSGGRYRGAFPAPGRGVYYVRAEYGKGKSTKEQLRVP
jgi:hypothetical protein